jgi:hypothetical protein
MTGPADTGPPARVVVTNPRMRARRRTTAYGVTQDIDHQTRLGEVYMASLIRSQLRLALLTCAVVTVAVAALPIVFWLTRDGWLGTGPWLPWVVLGFAGYPCLLLGAWWYVRHAERNEREFVDLVDRS